MLFGKVFKRLSRRFMRSQAGPQEEIEWSKAEAADQHLAKESKLEIANQAVMTGHVAQVAQNDVSDVENLKAKYLGGAWSQAKRRKKLGDIIVCDDYNVNRLWPWVLAGGLVLAGWWLYGRPAEVPPARGSDVEVSGEVKYVPPE